MWLYLGILLATIIIYLIRFHYELIRSVWYSMKIDGPAALPIIGNGLLFINKTSPENLQIIVQLVKKYGEFFRIWIGPELNILVSNPQDVEILLSSPRYIDKSKDYNFVKPWLNDGLLLSSGKKWHDRRKIITPAFHFNILERFIEVFDRLGNTVIEKLNKFDSSDDVEFYPIAVLYALDVMCETAMGVSVNALAEPNSGYVQSVKTIVNVIHMRIFDVVLRHPMLFEYSKLAKQQENALKFLHEFTDNVIKKRRQELLNMQTDNNANDQNKDSENIGIRAKRAFLDLLLHSTVDGKPLADHDIREEVDTFMFEGHDTTTSAITFTLYNIAKYEHVQQKCFEEIVQVFGNDKSAPTTLNELNQLNYLEMTIKETLRLFPSVPLIGRVAKEDIYLTKERVIPSGSNVVVPIYTMGHDENLFDDAETFNPNRFLGERSMDKQNAFAYIPFSAGPRNCIGQKFAMYELKSILSKILRNFHVKLTKESEPYPILSAELILRPENMIGFYFHPRIY